FHELEVFAEQGLAHLAEGFLICWVMAHQNDRAVLTYKMLSYVCDRTQRIGKRKSLRIDLRHYQMSRVLAQNAGHRPNRVDHWDNFMLDIEKTKVSDKSG